MPIRIAICAPAAPIAREDAARVTALAAAHFPGVELAFHEQCFASEGHFAGNDATRLAALLACANDPAADAVWFARGGYGSNRIAEAALAEPGGLSESAPAKSKTWLGYSDMGYLLAGLARAGIGHPAHGPMPADIRREGGDAAVLRALAFLSGDETGLEPSLAQESRPAAAFNLMTLAMLCGTPLMPDLSHHVVMIEEVSEHLYAIDRLFFHVTSHLSRMGIAGIRLGRVSDVPENDRPFGATALQIAQDWCARSGIAFLGSADIGHDAANKIVPFGTISPRGA